MMICNGESGWISCQPDCLSFLQPENREYPIVSLIISCRGLCGLSGRLAGLLPVTMRVWYSGIAVLQGAVIVVLNADLDFTLVQRQEP